MAQATPKSRDAFRRYLWPLLKRHRWHVLAAALLVGAHGFALSIQNLYPKWLIDDVLSPTDLGTPERWRRLAWLAVGYLAVTNIGRMALWHLGYRAFTAAREKIMFALRGQFFRHVNHLCLRFHGQHPSGELQSYLFGSPLGNVMGFFQHVSMNLPGSITNIAFTLALFWAWDWVIAVMLLGMTLVSVWMMRRSIASVQHLHKEFQDIEGDVSGRVADVLRGTKAVKLYAMETQVVEDFEERTRFIARKSYERDVRTHMEWMKQEGFSYLVFAGLMAACTWRYLGGHITIGIVTACLTSFYGLWGPLQSIFQAATLWGGAAASLERIGTVLETASTTPDPVAPAAVDVPHRGEIRFENVSFTYEAGQPQVKDIALTIPYGQRIALVGPSGAGKSTIAQLILRLYDPQVGAIRLGGVELRKFSGADLRKHIGVVPQDPFIFRATVRDNVRVSRPDADDAAIRRACELANAWEFIAELPKGLDSPVGEGGSTLSGGQRQRLAIARALLAEPPYFIFDEATSALDTLSEQLIQEALEKNLGGRTALFIAHRLATVKHCDRILVLQEGRVVQDGSYDALIRQPGLFAELVQGQQLRA